MKKFLFAILFLPVVVFAHGSGTTIERVSGEYKLDLDYEATKIYTGEPVRYNLKVTNLNGDQVVDFDSVWARVEKDKQVVFASALAKPEFGQAGLLFTFEKAGEYELYVRFEKAGKSLVEFSVPLRVESVAENSEKKPFPLQYVGVLVFGLVLGAGSMKYFSKKL